MKKLSPTMRRAFNLARDNRGRLIRLEGESWGGGRLVPLPGRGAWFTTRTIQALVSRRLADYTKWPEVQFDDEGVLIEASLKPTEITLAVGYMCQ